MTKKTSPTQLEREIAQALATPYRSKYGHGPAEYQSGYNYGKESTRHETHAEMREIQRRLSDAARTDFDRGMLAAYAEALGNAPKRSHAKVKKEPRRIAYRLKLTPDEMSAVEFARGRYSWPDMLAEHAAEDGSVAFTESEMWSWCDDVDSDAEGGHSPFPLAAPKLADKLQRFYDERV